ncbi:uncharacterized protein V6R79_021251 [Siganus canaliculatus]
MASGSGVRVLLLSLLALGLHHVTGLSVRNPPSAGVGPPQQIEDLPSGIQWPHGLQRPLLPRGFRSKPGSSGYLSPGSYDQQVQQSPAGSGSSSGPVPLIRQKPQNKNTFDLGIASSKGIVIQASPRTKPGLVARPRPVLVARPNNPPRPGSRSKPEPVARPNQPAGSLPRPGARPPQPAGFSSKPRDPSRPVARPNQPTGSSSKPGGFPRPGARPNQPTGSRSKPGGFPRPGARPNQPTGSRSKPGGFPRPGARPNQPTGSRSKPGGFPRPGARPNQVEPRPVQLAGQLVEYAVPQTKTGMFSFVPPRGFRPAPGVFVNRLRGPE